MKKIFGIVFDGEEFKYYELDELKDSGMYIHYIMQCDTPQIKMVVKMLNNVHMVVK